MIKYFFYNKLIQEERTTSVVRGRPLHRENKKNSGNGSELKVSLDAGLERVKIMCSRKVGQEASSSL